jgi:hypothetical protein
MPGVAQSSLIHFPRVASQLSRFHRFESTEPNGDVVCNGLYILVAPVSAAPPFLAGGRSGIEMEFRPRSRASFSSSQAPSHCFVEAFPVLETLESSGIFRSIVS